MKVYHFNKLWTLENERTKSLFHVRNNKDKDHGYTLIILYVNVCLRYRNMRIKITFSCSDFLTSDTESSSSSSFQYKWQYKWKKEYLGRLSQV